MKTIDKETLLETVTGGAGRAPAIPTNPMEFWAQATTNAAAAWTNMMMAPFTFAAPFSTPVSIVPFY